MKHKSLSTAIVIISVFLLFSVWSWIKPSDDFSKTERRQLKSAPEISVNTLLSGKFMTEFEEYTLDQFPIRNFFRNLKAMTENYVFHKSDNNNLYLYNGYISQIQYPMNEKSIQHAADRFAYVYETYLKNSNVYISVIPDKNYFMASESGHLSMDYDVFTDKFLERMPFAKYIDIYDHLSLDDYYKTDTHWKQNKIVDVANTLLFHMESRQNIDYLPIKLDKSFYGVYYGQMALPVKPDELEYLTSEEFNDYIVYDYEHDKEIDIYDMGKAYGDDPYEIFLSGPLSLVTITNPKSNVNKELILFRDSFGSNIAPLLMSGYSKITLIDIRYITPGVLGKYVDFENADVLFLYSTLVLNNSDTIK